MFTQLSSMNSTTGILMPKQYLRSYSASAVKIFIQSQQLWVEEANGECRMLDQSEIKNHKEVSAYLSQNTAGILSQDNCYVRVVETNSNEYSVHFNYRILGGGLCASMPMPDPEMIVAALCGDLITINRLLESGITPDSQRSISKADSYNCFLSPGSTALFFAAAKGNVDIVNKLLASGASVHSRNARQGTPLFGACLSLGYKNNIEIAKILISAGADINARNVEGNTPLILAANHSSAEMVEMLLSEGADINARNVEGSTPLMMAAAFSGSAEMVEMLLSEGADINAETNRGFVALDVACANPGGKPSSEVVRVLLEHGANVHRLCNSDTLLHRACATGDVPIIKMLLEAGVNPHQRNRNGKVASQEIRSGHLYIVPLLNNPPARIDYAGIGAAKRAAKAQERAEAEAKIALVERIRNNRAAYDQTLLKIAKSVVRQLFEDNGTSEQKEQVQSTLYDFFKSSQLLHDAQIDLADDASHAARRSSLTTALVNELKPKKYLWGLASFEAEELKDELKTIILIWSSKLTEEAFQKSRLNIAANQPTTIVNNAAFYQSNGASRAPGDKTSSGEQAAEHVGEAVGEQIGQTLVDTVADQALDQALGFVPFGSLFGAAAKAAYKHANQNQGPNARK